MPLGFLFLSMFSFLFFSILPLCFPLSSSGHDSYQKKKNEGKKRQQFLLSLIVSRFHNDASPDLSFKLVCGICFCCYLRICEILRSFFIFVTRVSLVKMENISLGFIWKNACLFLKCGKTLWAKNSQNNIGFPSFPVFALRHLWYSLITTTRC